MKQDNLNEGDWNTAELFTQRLNQRNEDCDNAFTEGDLLKAYRSLVNIYSMIKYKVKEKPEKELFEDTYADYIGMIQDKFTRVSGMLKGDSKLIKMNLTVSEGILTDIRELLYDLQWNLNIIFPENVFKSLKDEVNVSFS